MSSSDKEPPNPAEKKPAEGGIYAGLTSHSTDTYETIKMDKKPVVWSMEDLAQRGRWAQKQSFKLYITLYVKSFYIPFLL